MRLTVRGIEGLIHICSSDDFYSASRTRVGTSEQQRTADITDEWGARNFIHRYFRDAYEIASLRTALIPDVYDLALLTDEEVVREAALRLASGAWRLIFEGRPVRAGLAPLQSAARIAGGQAMLTQAPAPSAPVTLRANRRTDRIDLPEKSINAAPASSEEWLGTADQVAQAQTLQRAARLAVPFCAICAARAAALKSAAI